MNSDMWSSVFVADPASVNDLGGTQTHTLRVTDSDLNLLSFLTSTPKLPLKSKDFLV